MVLKGISPLISPSLLKILAEMGHGKLFLLHHNRRNHANLPKTGDEIVLADAHFPSHSICPPHIPVVRADGMYIFSPHLSYAQP
jgi:L-fucose mutarotase